jgi:hypothetical protein
MPRKTQEGSDEELVQRRMDAPQPASTGSAQQAHEQCFRLVIPGMSQSHTSGAEPSRRLPQEIIPNPSCRCLDSFRSMLHPVGGKPADMERNLEPGGQLPQEKLIGVGLLSSKGMVQVSRRKWEMNLLEKLRKEEQERRGIGTARHSDQHPLPWRPKGLASECEAEGLEQINWHKVGSGAGTRTPDSADMSRVL